MICASVIFLTVEGLRINFMIGFLYTLITRIVYELHYYFINNVIENVDTVLRRGYHIINAVF